MKSRNVHLMLLPCIGFALVVLTGCENTVTLGMGNYGKVILYPMNGDTLKWPFPVSFQGVAWPCEGPKQSTTQACKINVQYAPGQTVAKFHYNCDGCTDPELDVGPSTGLGATGTQAAPPPRQTRLLSSSATPARSQPTRRLPPLKKTRRSTGRPMGQRRLHSQVDGHHSVGRVESRPSIRARFAARSYDHAQRLPYTVHDASGACKDVTGTIKVVAP